MPRSPLLHGLGLTLRHPRPLLWAYAFNLAIAWLTTIGIRNQYSTITANSLASQRLITGFDLGVALDAARRLSDGPPVALTPSFLTTPLYLLLFFLLVPGTLLTYQTDTSLRLGTLLQVGLQPFWSFIRLTLLFLLVAAPTIALLTAMQSAANTRIDRTITGQPAFLLNLVGYAVIFLAAALIRLFFDLVEVHTVHQSQFPLPNGKPDRRIRKTLRPAFTTLRRHLLPAYLTFVLLTFLGATAAFLLTRSALHHLAQPHIWPTFLLAQLAIFLLLFTRFWLRAAETIYVQNDLPLDNRARIFAQTNPTPLTPIEPTMSTFPTPAPDNPVSPILPGPDSNPLPSPSPDPIPGSEPVSPSLASPDPGVFHHEVVPTPEYEQ